MLKRIALIFAVFMVVFSVFAGRFGAGAMVSYEPSDRNLFGGTDPLTLEDFDWGLNLRYEFGKAGVFTLDIIPKSIYSGHFKIETITSVSGKINIKDQFNIECGYGITLAVERPVEGSDQIVITANGVAIQNVFTLRNLHLLSLLGVLRPRLSLSKQVTDSVLLKADYEMNLFSVVKIYPEGSIPEFFGMGKVSLGAVYQF